MVISTLRLTKDFIRPEPKFYDPVLQIRYMGQDLMNPPTVEGWHTGKEWIDSGSLVERINYVADELSDTSKPGVRAMVDYLLLRTCPGGS